MPKYTYELFDGDNNLLHEFTTEYDVQAVRGQFYGTVPTGLNSASYTKTPIFKPPGYEEYTPLDEQDGTFSTDFLLHGDPNFTRQLRVTDPNGNVITDESLRYGEDLVRSYTGLQYDEGTVLFAFTDDTPEVPLPGEKPPAFDASYPRPWL
jgi:hypothetical protein